MPPEVTQSPSPLTPPDSPPDLTPPPGPAARVGWFLAGPVVLGALSGLAAAWSAPVYWPLQLVGITGALFTTPAQRRLRATGTGALGGLAFGIAMMLVLTATTRTEVIDLGDPREFHVVVTTVAGALLTLAGSRIAARRARRSS